MGHITELQRCIFSHPHKSHIQEVSKVSPKRPDLSIYGSSFWPGNGSLGVHESGQGGEVDGTVQRYKDPTIPRMAVCSEPPCRSFAYRHTQILLALCCELGWVVNISKSELVPQQEFSFVGYCFDLCHGRVRPTPERWECLQQKIHALKSQDNCLVRQFMSLWCQRQIQMAQ